MKQGSSNSTWGKLICTFSLNNSDLKDIQVYPSYHKYVPPSFWQSNSYQIKSRATLPCKYPLTQNLSFCTHESLSNLSCVFISVSLWRELLQLSTWEQFGQTFSGFSPALDKIGVYLRLHLVANNVHTIWHNSDLRHIHVYAYTNCFYVGWTETEQTKLNVSIILSLFIHTALYVSDYHTLFVLIRVSQILVVYPNSWQDNM